MIKKQINNRKSSGLKHFNDSTAFIEYSNNMIIFIKALTDTTQLKNVKY